MKKTITQLLTAASTQIDRLDAEVLLAHVLKKPREFLISHDGQQVGKYSSWQVRSLVKKRKRGIPVAYLTGKKEFFGLEFNVNKHTLIPRPDTELLVSLTLEEMQNVILIDVGTGSGCIPIAIAKSLTHYPLPVTSYATDISRAALRVARRNAKKHGVDITFKQGNLLSPFTQELRTKNQEPLIITANLPYLTHEQFTSEPSIQHEPKSALVADNDGLALYDELLQQIQSLISPAAGRDPCQRRDNHQSPIICFFEIDPTQSERMQMLVKKYFPDANFEMKKDLAGLDRVVKISL